MNERDCEVVTGEVKPVDLLKHGNIYSGYIIDQLRDYDILKKDAAL